MSLLPRTTLHSDSEQFIHNWMLEDDLDPDRGIGRSSSEGRAKEKLWKVFTQLSQASACVLAVVLDQGLAERRHRKTKEKGVMQTKS